VLLASEPGDWYLIEVVDRILDKGIVFEGNRVGPRRPGNGSS
jgi:hypothetical protein